MARERRQVFYSGRVQGVGFRFTCHRLAQGFDVSGFVRNLDDGRVEALVEGDRDVLDAFLTAIRGAFGARIRDERSETLTPAETTFDTFFIQY